MWTPCLCDHLIYAFASMNNNEITSYEWDDVKLYGEFQAPEEPVSFPQQRMTHQTGNFPWSISMFHRMATHKTAALLGSTPPKVWDHKYKNVIRMSLNEHSNADVTAGNLKAVEFDNFARKTWKVFFSRFNQFTYSKLLPTFISRACLIYDSVISFRLILFSSNRNSNLKTLLANWRLELRRTAKYVCPSEF